MCGFEFDRQDTLCAHGCPLGALCRLISCPACGFEFPEQPKSVSLLRRLLKKEKPVPAELREGVGTVRELRGGECATVLCLCGDSPSRHNALAVFGLVPGAEITLLQHHPSCVVRIGETELALDSDIARDIVVQRLPERAIPA